MTQKVTHRKNTWVERFAKLLDSEFRIPGTDLKFGLDPLIGLIPGLGDVIGYVASAVVVIGIVQKGVSGKIIFQMLLNILLDMLIGLVPMLGTFFDFVYKANTRNIQLLRAYQKEKEVEHVDGETIIVEDPNEKGSNTVLVIVAVLAALFMLFVALLYLVMSVTLRILSTWFD